MATHKYAAHTENRIFYFYITNQGDNEINITMYNTPYTLIKNGENWENHHSNNFAMAQHLIDAVIYSIKNRIVAE
ncbi:hypothetical protein [Mucilaginibacter sp. BT774]|uniref:hypothetical protein n=1 Tax=Mucilaginibacter sp. BT774 TaxID=3062276 RepID=UPI002675794C|nr:hypothetical protein [Mucilaginibacter sp. BT774]MDO3627541.1 hypothetical protein [Mucilaginibacter sp. BT774]